MGVQEQQLAWLVWNLEDLDSRVSDLMSLFVPCLLL